MYYCFSSRKQLTHVKRRTRLCTHNEIIASELTIYDWNVINKSKKATRTTLDLLKHITKLICLMSSSFCFWGLKLKPQSDLRSCFYLFFKWISLLLNGFIRFHHQPQPYRFCDLILIKRHTEIVFFSAFGEPQTMFEYRLTARSKLNVIFLLFFINARDPTSLIKS